MSAAVPMDYSKALSRSNSFCMEDADPSMMGGATPSTLPKSNSFLMGDVPQSVTWITVQASTGAFIEFAKNYHDGTNTVPKSYTSIVLKEKSASSTSSICFPRKLIHQLNTFRDRYEAICQLFHETYPSDRGLPSLVDRSFVQDKSLIEMIDTVVSQLESLYDNHVDPNILVNRVNSCVLELKQYRAFLVEFFKEFNVPAKSSQALVASELGNKYTLIGPCGGGSYANVFHCKVNQFQPVLTQSASSAPSRLEKAFTEVAIKKIYGFRETQQNTLRTLREIKIYRGLFHPNIVKLRSILPPNSLYNFNDLSLVFEKWDFSLQKVISREYLMDIQVKYILYKLLSGVKYLHASGVLHRDLKPANVLVNEDCNVAICDLGFGYAKPMVSASQESPASQSVSSLPPAPERKREMTSYITTRWFRAPEVILKNVHYTSAIDIWAVGCIFAEILQAQVKKPANRTALFPGTTCYPYVEEATKDSVNSEFDQLNLIFNVIGTPLKKEIDSLEAKDSIVYLNNILANPELQKMPLDLSKLKLFANDVPIGAHLPNSDQKIEAIDTKAYDLMSKMLKFDHRERITAEEAMKHPYFKGFQEGAQYPPAKIDMGYSVEEEDKLTTKDLKKHIIKEVVHYNPELAADYQAYVGKL